MVIFFFLFFNFTDTDPSLESIPSADQIQGPYNVEQFNCIASTLQLSPISSRSMRSMNYRVQKSAEITKAVRKNIFGMDSDDVNKSNDFDEMIMQLKEKFNLPSTSTNDKLKVLSVLPKSWSVNQIVNEFNAPHHTVKQMKRLVREQGILCS